MNYGQIIKEAVRIFCRYKVLWIFGVVITLFGQGEYVFRVRENGATASGEIIRLDILSLLTQKQIDAFLANPLPYLIYLGLIGLAIWFVSLLAAWSSQAALIMLVGDINRGLGVSLSRGWFWVRLDGLQLTRLALFFAFLYFLLFSPFLVLGAVVLDRSGLRIEQLLTGGNISNAQVQTQLERLVPYLREMQGILIPLLIFGLLAGWLVWMLHQVSARVYMLEDRRLLDAIRRGWQVMRQNFGYIILTSAALAAAGAIFGALVAPPAVFLGQTQSSGETVRGLLLGFYLLVMQIGLGGALTSFNSVLWTRLYIEMTEREKLKTMPEPAAAAKVRT
jgi:hypothetical protein